MYGSAGALGCTVVIPSLRTIPEEARVNSGEVGVATAATDDEPLDGDTGAVDGRPTRRRVLGA